MNVPDAAYQMFDYVVNNRRTHEMLGQAVQLLERRAKRYRVTIEQEINGHGGYLSSSATRWSRLLSKACHEARADYLKTFPDEECPDWVGPCRDNWGTFGVDCDWVIKIAIYQHRDWWP